jgi:hypothetical protein
MKMVLGSLLVQHRFELAEDKPIKTMPRTFTIGPQGGVRLINRGRAAGAQNTRFPGPVGADRAALASGGQVMS